MATTVEDLVLRFSAETERLQRDLKKVERSTEKSGKRAAKSTNRISKSLKGVSASAKRAGAALLAAFSARALQQAWKALLSGMNDLDTAATGLGVTTDLIQELTFAFTKAGADGGKVTKVLTDFIKRIGEARAGLGTLLPFLKKFDIDLDNANGTAKTSGQLFDELSDTIAGLKDNTARGALGNAAFGRSWVDVVAVLGQGSEALKDVRREARETGAVIDEQLVKAAAAADIQFNILAATMKGRLSISFLRWAQELGVIDLTKLQQLNKDIITFAKARNKLIDEGVVRKSVRGVGVLSPATEEEINAANDLVLAAQLALKNFLNPPAASGDGSTGASDAVDKLGLSLKKIGSSVLKADKDIEKFREGELQKVIDAEQDAADRVEEWSERFEQLGPTAEDSVFLIADAFEDLLFNMGEADDAVKNLIVSFGRLIVRQIALNAASKIVTSLGFGFADGGVMTGGGPAPLKKYASGGIARTPQTAIFGEGSRPEAFVPLPDGRSIPVTVKGEGGAMGGAGVTVIQENHFGGGIERDVTALMLQFMPMIVEATKNAVAADSQGIRI